MTGDDLAAAILAGGQSRRMGENKALLRLDPSGPTVIETVVDTLRAITPNIVLVGSNLAAYESLGLPQVPDLVPGIGALGGIHAALASTTASHLLVVACDLPFLNVALLHYMATRPRDYDALVPMLDRPQPLHAIYTHACLPPIEQGINSGNYRATGWLAGVNVRSIERETMQSHDPELLSCFNMNTPEDVTRAKQRIATMSHRHHLPRT
jgi:molybdopterin-guanine dinucleotide biosynthesis protein A